MARYIDADLLIENISKIKDLRTLSTKTVGIAISATPTADVVEVVRCKDCRQFMEYAEGLQGIENTKGDCFIRMMCSIDRQFYGVKYDDFCSYGERSDT